MKLDATQGVLIADVTPGSPAEKAGIKRGDVVLKIDGQVVDSTGRLRNVVATAGKGATVEIEVLRGADRETVRVNLGEMPAAVGGVAMIDPSQGVLGGLTVADLSPELREKHDIPERVTQGVVVKSLAPDSQAAAARMRPGDVIMELAGEPIRDVQHFTRLYERAEGKVLLLIFRNGSTAYLLVTK